MVDTLVVQNQSTLARPIVQPQELIEFHKEVSQIITQALERGIDYGSIPGVKQECLLKPGAERLALAFGAHPEYQIISQEIDHSFMNEYKDKYGNDQKSTGLYRYVYKCRLVRHDGRVLGEADGSCSSLETKFISRPRDVENTVLKMAQKRALVAATLNAFALSNRFTQDVDEMDIPLSSKATAWKPSEPQINRFKAIRAKSKFSEKDIAQHMLMSWEVKSEYDLNREQYDEICKYMEANKA